MKAGAIYFLVGVVALLAGLALGGLGPKAEIRALKAQLEEAGECSEGGVGAEIANVFRGRPWEEGEQRKVTRFAEPTPEPEPAVPDAPSEPETEIRFGGGEVDAPADLEEGMGLAREAMELRYTQARAALIEDADPSEEQLEAIDAAMTEMNDKLIELAEGLVEELAEGQPDRRETMLYAAETLDTLLSAEESMMNTLSEDQLANLQDASLDPLSYVDPAIVDMLEQLDRP